MYKIILIDIIYARGCIDKGRYWLHPRSPPCALMESQRIQEREQLSAV